MEIYNIVFATICAFLCIAVVALIKKIFDLETRLNNVVITFGEHLANDNTGEIHKSMLKRISKLERLFKSLDETVLINYDEHEQVLKEMLNDEEEFRNDILELKKLYNGIVSLASKSNLTVDEWLCATCNDCEIRKACRAVSGALERVQETFTGNILKNKEGDD